MKLILQQEVKGLGKKDAIVEVSEGYARNFLLPKKLALPATDSTVKQIKDQQAAQARREQQAMDEARMLASQLSKVSVTIGVKTGEGGKLFGSVTGKDVADAIERQHGLTIDKRKVELKDSVKSIGTYNATVRIHPDVSAQVSVNVVGE
ncbi:50S ribosomal protein L9 [Anaerosporomusa subterranea]|uniref:Large ribosomal subunit protein bL9 n=1 Tax=Anaerosporomusa subterranea TaxID=1794912 RepID=A0A154BPE4_ANASB|nr:50S ribosomal protein L9 [Anaerosporomusa subterranea]KYZ75769.1 50S ribosomal protein L9 [Anaerosporomusa subterranea]